MKTRVYIDMDGVVATFVKSSLRRHGKELPVMDATWDFPRQIGFTGADDPLFWGPLEDHDFWAGLDRHEDGMALYANLVSALGEDRLSVLSSAAVKASGDGKRTWLGRHLPNQARRPVYTSRKGQVAGLGTVLVDDYQVNCDEFRGAGGVAVVVPRPWNSRRGDCLPDGSFDVTRLTAEVLDAVRLEDERCRRVQAFLDHPPAVSGDSVG